LPSTYQLISSNVLTSSAASVTFSSIPATFTDLAVRVSLRSDRANTQDDVRITFNSTTTNYSYTYMRGNGSAVTTSFSTSDPWTWFGNIDAANAASNTFANGELYIPSYTVSQSKPASAIMAMEDNATASFMTANANLWRNNAAISSITFALGFGSFVSGSSFYLYGIKNS